jgi:hypothetical protein
MVKGTERLICGVSLICPFLAPLLHSGPGSYYNFFNLEFSHMLTYFFVVLGIELGLMLPKHAFYHLSVHTPSPF